MLMNRLPEPAAVHIAFLCLKRKKTPSLMPVMDVSGLNPAQDSLLENRCVPSVLIGLTSIAHDELPAQLFF